MSRTSLKLQIPCPAEHKYPPAASKYAPQSRFVEALKVCMSSAGRLGSDPRHFQIFALGGLLLYGVTTLNFGIDAVQIAITLGVVLLAQFVLTHAFGTGAFEARSALISGLSLCLLLRVEALSIAVLAAVLAIASKFILRWRHSHVFNPTAFAISVTLLSTDVAWVSPGQWGHTALVMLVVAGFGLLVLTRAQRLDIALAFALGWSAAILARTWWYHDPLSIAAHQLSNGAALLFCFFMITDPRTTPDSRGARVLFALAVAFVGALINFGLYRSDGLIFALALCAPLNLVLNHYWHLIQLSRPPISSPRR